MGIVKQLGKIVKPAVVKKKTFVSVGNDDDVVKPVPSTSAKFEPNSDGIRYWLVKSEPLKRIDKKTGKDVSFPMSELLKVETESWDGVRNWELRNSMLHMSTGDIALFYHSNCPNPGIVGLVKIAKEAQPDESQFDSTRQYFDLKSTRQKPRWWCVDVAFERRLRHKISLVDLKLNPKLENFMLVKRGRLSVIPVSQDEYDEILRMEAEGDIKDDIDCEIDHKLIFPK